ALLETELKHYGSLSTHTEIRGLNLCTHLHTREAHSGQHSIELGRKGNTRSRKGRAGSPKGEGGKYDNVSYVLARTIRSN
ncbi:unnamed protein product, partial [Pylaiella littoralis]